VAVLLHEQQSTFSAATLVAPPRLPLPTAAPSRSQPPAEATGAHQPTSSSEFHKSKSTGEHPQRALAAYSVMRQDGQGSLGFAASEQLLVRDLLLVFQGINGQYVQYNPTMDAFAPTAASGLAGSTARMVMSLGELGWLWRRLQHFRRKADEHVRATGSVVMQALCTAVDTEAMDYLRLVAVLEQQQRTATSDEGTLTLRRLVVWLQQPKATLRTLICMLEDAAGMLGGALCAAVYRYTQHGDPAVASLAARVLRMTAAPLFRMIQLWCVTGDAGDAAGEFFIAPIPEEDAASGKGVQGGEWKASHRLVPELVPPFLDGPTARTVLLLGKSVHFVSHACQDEEWAYVTRADRMLRGVDTEALLPTKNTEHNHDKQSPLAAQNLARCGLEQAWALRCMLQRAVLPANIRVMRLVVNKAQLGTHLQALKSFILLGAGDFVSQLMSDMQPILDRPAAEVAGSTHHLLGVLESAVRSSNAQYLPVDVLDRLALKLHTAHEGDLGWDVFSLTYALKEPLSSVVPPAAMAVYGRIFRFLWRLKRVQHSLSVTWCRNATASHTLSSFPELTGVLHLCHLIRADMHAFVQSLSAYVMFEVLESAWNELQTSLAPAQRMLDPELSVRASAAAAAGGTGKPSRSPGAALVAAAVSGVDAPSTPRGGGRGAEHSGAFHADGGAGGVEDEDEGGVDMAGLISAHERYLRRILHHACLDGRTSFVGPYISALLEEILTFIGEQEQLYGTAMRIVVSSERDDGADVSDDLHDLSVEYRAALRECLSSYRERMGELLGVLELGGQELEAFRFLLLQFDFSGFYDKRRKGGAAQ